MTLEQLRDQFNAEQQVYREANLTMPYQSFLEFARERLPAEDWATESRRCAAEWSKAPDGSKTRASIHFAHEGTEFAPSHYACPACGTRLHRSIAENPILVICLNGDCESEAAGVAASSRESAEDAAQKLYQAVTKERSE